MCKMKYVTLIKVNLCGKSSGIASREKRLRNQITQEMLPNIIYQHWVRQRLLADIPEFDQFRLYPVTCYEIQKIAMSFSSKKALGLDKVSMSVIKDALPCNFHILTHIYYCMEKSRGHPISKGRRSRQC